MNPNDPITPDNNPASPSGDNSNPAFGQFENSLPLSPASVNDFSTSTPVASVAPTPSTLPDNNHTPTPSDLNQFSTSAPISNSDFTTAPSNNVSTSALGSNSAVSSAQPNTFSSSPVVPNISASNQDVVLDPIANPASQAQTSSSTAVPSPNHDQVMPQVQLSSAPKRSKTLLFILIGVLLAILATGLFLYFNKMIEF